MASPLQIANLQTLRSCRLCIVCAKSTEAIHVKERLNLRTKISGRDTADLPAAAKGHDFWLGSFTLDGKSSLSYYIMSLSRQGIQSCAIETATLFTILRPTFALLVGTCAAMKDQGYSCEDVVFGEKALNYEEGKWGVENGAPVFSADAYMLRVIGECMEGFIQQTEREDWKYGDFVSGCAVRMDAAHIFDRVKKTQLRNVGALEMEASAFLQACTFTGVEALGVIKGVSDMGDERKELGHETHYRPALYNAIDATKSFLKWKLHTIPDETPDISQEPGVIIVSGYFANYVLKVIQKLFTRDKVIDVNGEVVEIKGLKIVMPKENNPAYFDDLSYAVEAIYKVYRLVEVCLPGSPRSTPIRVKGNYAFDFPTTLGSSFSKKQTRQVEYFEQALKNRIAPHERFVEVLDWKSFVVLSENLDRTSGSETPTAEGFTHA